MIRELHVALALTREVNVATQSSAYSAVEIRESGRAFQSLDSLGEEAAFINICIGSLKWHLAGICWRKSQSPPISLGRVVVVTNEWCIVYVRYVCFLCLNLVHHILLHGQCTGT